MTDCILHTGCKTKGGYGLKSFKGKLMLAHRVAYMLAKGAIPDGMVVMHLCDNPLCVNPEHLRAGTQKENRQDCIMKGRHNASRGEEHVHSKLTEKDVRAIRASTLNDCELAKLYNVSRRTVSDARRGKTWRHI